MTQEELNILNVDLCARLPYGVKIKYLPDDRLDGIVLPYLHNRLTVLQKGAISYRAHIKSIRPYLRPMSSMTEEEVKEIRKINWQFWKPKNDSDECFVGDADDGYCSVSQMAHIINYLNAHHFDYRGLIEKGLALEAPEGMYKTE